ncbi:MAG: hypothetical protein ACFHVJ_01965 [Aestuariibacter sp.]
MIFLPKHICLLMAFFVQNLCFGLEIQVLDKSGQPVENVAIALIPVSTGAKQIASQLPLRDVVLSQKDRQFSPYLITIQNGASVSFLNEDAIRHQVYARSEIATFDMNLKSGEHSSGVRLTSSGEMAVGCNIHDWMQAYVFVVDTPYYSATNENGKAQISLPDNESYELKAWHPRFQSSDLDISKNINTPATTTVITLQQELLPDANAIDDFDDLSDLDIYE